MKLPKFELDRRLERWWVQTKRKPEYDSLRDQRRTAMRKSNYISECDGISVSSEQDESSAIDALLASIGDEYGGWQVYRWHKGNWEQGELVRKTKRTVTIKWSVI